MLQVTNSKAFGWFVAGVVLASLLTTLAVMFLDFTVYTIALPYVVYTIIFFGMLLLRPNYVAIQFSGNKLYISSGIQQESLLEIPQHEYAGYKLNPSVYNTVHTLLVYRKVAKGYLQSRPIRITLMTKQQLILIKEALERFKPPQQ